MYHLCMSTIIMLFMLYGRQAIVVTADDVLITETMETSDGLRVSFAVRVSTGGLVSASDVVTAVRV